MGAKMMPTAKNSGSTVRGVKMGCQAFSRCWRKALSVHRHQPTLSIQRASERIASYLSSLGGLLLFGWSFLSTSSLPCVLLASVCCCTCVCDMSAMVVGRSYDEEEDMRKKGETGGGMNRTQALGGTTNWHQVKRDASVLSPPARTDMLT